MQSVDSIALSPDPNSRRLSGGANRRLSGGGRRLSGWRPEDVENFFDENDDEKEREAAAERRKAEQLKEVTRSPFRETPSHAKRRQMYTDCIQMAAEDKVNAQNSWHLDLIDHMGHMIAEPAGGTDASGQPNFQMASTTLDAGVKIYSYRVDSVFNQTFKLVGGLNRTSRNDGAGEDKAIGDERARTNPAEHAQRSVARRVGIRQGAAHQAYHHKYAK